MVAAALIGILLGLAMAQMKRGLNDTSNFDKHAIANLSPEWPELSAYLPRSMPVLLLEILIGHEQVPDALEESDDERDEGLERAEIQQPLTCLPHVELVGPKTSHQQDRQQPCHDPIWRVTERLLGRGRILAHTAVGADFSARIDLFAAVGAVARLRRRLPESKIAHWLFLLLFEGQS